MDQENNQTKHVSGILKWFAIILVLLVILILSLSIFASKNANNLAPTPSPTNEAPQDDVTSPTSSQSDRRMYPEVVELAREDLSKKLNRAIDEITVTKVDETEWSDGSLGCPEPDMMYTQAIVPGYRAELQINNETYIYHTDMNSRVVSCDK